MIAIDRKICKDILTLTNQYDDTIVFTPSLGGFAHWKMIHPEKPEIIPSVPIHEIDESLGRLNNAGLIKKVYGIGGGGMIFCITPELVHYKAFWFDRFTKTYIAGFISGVLTALISGLLVHFLTGLF